MTTMEERVAKLEAAAAECRRQASLAVETANSAHDMCSSQQHLINALRETQNETSQRFDAQDRRIDATNHWIGDTNQRIDSLFKVAGEQGLTLGILTRELTRTTRHLTDVRETQQVHGEMLVRILDRLN